MLCKRTDLLNIMVMRQFCGPRYTNITSCWGSGRLPNSYIIDGFWVDSTNDDQGRKTEEEKNTSNIRYHYQMPKKYIFLCWSIFSTLYLRVWVLCFIFLSVCLLGMTGGIQASRNVSGQLSQRTAANLSQNEQKCFLSVFLHLFARLSPVNREFKIRKLLLYFHLLDSANHYIFSGILSLLRW